MAAHREIGKLVEAVKSFEDNKAYGSAKKRFSEKAEVDYYSSDEHSKMANFRAENLIKEFLKKKGKVLDIGCATGQISAILAKKGFEVDGIDLSKEMIAEAKIRNKGVAGVKFRQGDIINFNSEKKYNYALALFNLITYFPNEETRVKVLSNMIRSLNNEGTAIVELVNVYGSLRLTLKALAFKIAFLVRGKNRPFGDVYSSPMFPDSNEVLYQHFFSKGEIEKLLKNVEGIEFKVRYYDMFKGETSKKNMVVLIRRKT